MKALYQCWDKESGCDSRWSIFASTAKIAAEEYSRQRDAHDVEYPGSRVVCVQLLAGTVREYEVELRSKPVYHAKAVKA